MLAIVVLCACGNKQRGTAWKCGDDRGVRPAKAARLVSLTPSATEIVAALGATDKLVGVDAYSTFPPDVQALPKVGSFLTPNLEVILGLRPTLVIVDDVHDQAGGALRDAGLDTLECPIHSLPDVKRALKSVGTHIGRGADAERAVAAIDTALDTAASARPAKRPRVLAVIDREAGGLGNLVAAGPGSWVDELVSVAGGYNVLASVGMRYPKLSLEEVHSTTPDVILDVSYAAKVGVEAWQRVDIPAVKNGKVVALHDDLMTRPTPRIREALDRIREAIGVAAPAR